MTPICIVPHTPLQLSGFLALPPSHINLLNHQSTAVVIIKMKKAHELGRPLQASDLNLVTRELRRSAWHPRWTANFSPRELLNVLQSTCAEDAHWGANILLKNREDWLLLNAPHVTHETCLQ